MKERLFDNIFKAICYSFAIFILALLALFFIILYKGAKPSIDAFGLGFLTSSEWDPISQKFGALSTIYGTVVSSIIAVIIALPVSIGIAIFITEMSPKWLRGPIGAAIELLAAIPSIIYGMWGLFVLVPIMSDKVEPFLINYLNFLPLFRGNPVGIGMLTAGIILSIMIIPFISSVIRDIFFMVPPLLKESGYGIGATKVEVLRKIVIPYTFSGMAGGVILGLGRALGETMAVTFVIGNTHKISASIINPATTIAASLANEFTEATEELYLSSLIELSLVLFGITIIILAFSRLMISRIGFREGKA